MHVGPKHGPINMLDGMKEVMMVIPINGDIDEAMAT